jgi:hypothetical protein
MQKENALIAASIVLVLAAGIADCSFIRREAALRSTITMLQNQLQIPLNVPLRLPLSGTSMSGDSLMVNLTHPEFVAGKRQRWVVFVLSPECGPCAANWVNWRELLGNRKSIDDWQPLFVALRALVRSRLQGGQ